MSVSNSQHIQNPVVSINHYVCVIMRILTDMGINKLFVKTTLDVENDRNEDQMFPIDDDFINCGYEIMKNSDSECSILKRKLNLLPKVTQTQINVCSIL